MARLARIFLTGSAAWIAAAANVQIESRNIRVEFDSRLHSRVVARFDGKDIPLGDFGPAEYVTAGSSAISDFTQSSTRQDNVRDERGRGRRLTLTGVAGGLQKNGRHHSL